MDHEKEFDKVKNSVYSYNNLVLGKPDGYIHTSTKDTIELFLIFKNKYIWLGHLTRLQ